ncbi:MAG: hypothetical protein PUC26_05815 [Eubacteriales bacterium]|nr:hypothetical protein [Eubacteriales bacterium]
MAEWTKRQIAWLREHAADPVSTSVLADQMEKIFGVKRSPDSVKMFMYNHGITRGGTVTAQMVDWIRCTLGEYVNGEKYLMAFREKFPHTTVSRLTFDEAVSAALKAQEKEREPDIELDADYVMRHIRMRASDYRRTCCVCGRRTYQAETVIGKDGKKKTYCPQCFKKRRRIHAR